MKRIVVLGSNGFVGQNLVRIIQALPNTFELIAVSRSTENLSAAKNYNAFDCLDSSLLQRFLSAVQPDVIVNLIALSQVDQCEENEAECFAINAEFPKVLASFCKQNAIKLVHLSTDFVFDGKRGMYRENEPPQPISQYGKSKVLGEKHVLETLHDALVIRTVLVYGWATLKHRTNILSWLINQLIAGKSVHMANDQFRTPTFVEDLCQGILLGIEHNSKGILHISGKDYLSVFDFANKIAEAFQLDQSLIQPSQTNQIGHSGQRPLITGFDLSKAVDELGFEPKSISEALIELKVQRNLGS